MRVNEDGSLFRSAIVKASAADHGGAAILSAL
jgi:hypothetical protein